MNNLIVIKNEKDVCEYCKKTIDNDNFYVINHKHIHDYCYHFKWQTIYENFDFKKERVGIC